MKLSTVTELKNGDKLKITFDSNQVVLGCNKNKKYWEIEHADGTRFVLDTPESIKEVVDYVEKHK